VGGVEESTVGLDDALFEGRRELRCVGVETADEVEALHLIAGQLENFALEDTKLDPVDFSQLRNEIDVATAAGCVGHDVAAVVASRVREGITGHTAAVALVLGCRRNAAGDDVAVKCEIEKIREGSTGFARFDFNDLG